jgi:succinate-semialdehyde dehydrogenase/glutarate-semialdehyde dehydrogenase
MTTIQETLSVSDTHHQPNVILVTSPVTGKEVGAVPRHSPDDVLEAVQRARNAQPAWVSLSFRQRAKVIIRFHDLILRERESLFDVIQAEAGKSRRDAFAELFAVASEARYWVYHGEKWLRPQRIRPAIPLRERAMVVYRPVGVVGIISPWNFPLVLAAADAIPALLAGNAVVLKPATLTPLTALWMRQKLIESGLPKEVLQIVTGTGSALGNALIDSVDYVMFTGSTEVGHKVAERAARRLIPYSMELGGKNALLVLADAHIKHAAQVAIEGTFNNAGQVCINFERLYVESGIYDAFVEELLRQTRALRLGSERSYHTDVGSLISEDQLRTVEEHVQDAVNKGAKILAGGRRRPDLGPLFYEPTILTDVTPEMTLYSEETFGPVLSVYKVDSADEAVRLINDSRYGLHAAVATRNRRRGEQIAMQLQAGTVCVNDSYIVWAAIEGPMGGFKESGVGRRHGPEGIRKYTEPQTILTNRTYWQIGSGETALSLNDWLANLLARLLRLWRHIPLLR